MANGVNAPFGLRPLNSINGGSWTEKLNTYYISTSTDGQTTYASNIFTGDPVVWNPTAANNGAGTIARYAFNSEGIDADNAVPILGVFMGCEYILPSGTVVNTLGKSAYWPASTIVARGSQIKAFVLDDPSSVFDIQVSTWTNTLADAVFLEGGFGGNWGLGLGGGAFPGTTPANPADGTTLTGQSGAYLARVFATNTPAYTTVTLPLKAIGWTLNPNNLSKITDYPGANATPFANVRVMINNHVYKVGTLGTVAV